ncbi:DUF6098 family protein [Streptomyces sp. ISL-98]|uniref:DUF6098 family protein n=1 Tax=Streptomyces sp. ISL-98 TaxID=2819192 RepID=UPI0027E4032A|nr:DUF6098 family protein [Streptomyces sp. ISL-98]
MTDATMPARSAPRTGMSSTADELPVLRTLDEVTALVERHEHLYVRWSRGAQGVAQSAGRRPLIGSRRPGNRMTRSRQRRGVLAAVAGRT